MPEIHLTHSDKTPRNELRKLGFLAARSVRMAHGHAVSRCGVVGSVRPVLVNDKKLYTCAIGRCGRRRRSVETGVIFHIGRTASCLHSIWHAPRRARSMWCEALFYSDEGMCRHTVGDAVGGGVDCMPSGEGAGIRRRGIAGGRRKRGGEPLDVPECDPAECGGGSHCDHAAFPRDRFVTFGDTVTGRIANDRRDGCDVHGAGNPNGGGGPLG